MSSCFLLPYIREIGCSGSFCGPERIIAGPRPCFFFWTDISGNTARNGPIPCQVDNVFPEPAPQVFVEGPDFLQALVGEDGHKDRLVVFHRYKRGKVPLFPLFQFQIDPVRSDTVKAVYDAGFLSFVQQALTNAAPRFRDVKLYGESIVFATDMEKRYAALPVGVNAKRRLQTVADWVESEIRNHFLIHRREIENRLLHDEEDGAAYTFLYKQLLDGSVNRARQMVLDAVKSDPLSLYLRFFRQYGQQHLFNPLL